MKVADICTREVVSIGRSGTLQEAAALMRERHVGALVVIGDPAPTGAQVAGIVTDRDLVIEAVARGLDIRQTEVGRFAEGNLAAVGAGASVHDAIAAMKKRGVRRLLVAGDQGELFGIVSMDDLLDALTHEMSDLAQAVRGGIEREATEREPLRAPPPVAARIPDYSFV